MPRVKRRPRVDRAQALRRDRDLRRVLDLRCGELVRQITDKDLTGLSGRLQPEADVHRLPRHEEIAPHARRRNDLTGVHPDAQRHADG